MNGLVISHTKLKDMPDFNEDLLQLIWQNKLFKPIPLITKSGIEIQILKPGDLNKDSGPDFFNAKIRIADLILVGNIEIHIKTSDWLKHKHQNDKAYDNIILHAVYEHDKEIIQNTKNHVEILELKPLISEKTIETYRKLVFTKEKLPCHGQLKTITDLKFISWIDRMAIERLEIKTKRIEHIFNSYHHDYTQTFFTILIRNFGFKVNAVPFELIAKQLPVHCLLKHADNLLQLEALLLGISGLLDAQSKNKYIQSLQNEFEFLKNKYNLIPLNHSIFKFSRLRPANFPTIRLIQLAKLIYTNSDLLIAPQKLKTYNQIKKALQINLSGYWLNHYTLTGDAVNKELGFGKDSIENIIINTFAPFYFFYSKKLSKPEFGIYAIELLNNCSFEINSKTKLYSDKKNILKTASDSQALINLYDGYCSKKKCLNCGIASELLKS